MSDKRDCPKCHTVFINTDFTTCPECGAELPVVGVTHDSFLHISDEDIEVMNEAEQGLRNALLGLAQGKVSELKMSDNARIMLMIATWTSLLARGLSFFKKDPETFDAAMVYALSTLQEIIEEMSPTGEEEPPKSDETLH